ALTVARLTDGLRARGHAVSVVCPRMPGRGSRTRRVCLAAAGLDHAHDLETTRVRGVALPCYRELRAGLPAGRTLCDRWTRQRPDVVYVATEGPLGWSASRAARRLGVPVFSGFHTRFPDYVRHYG